MENSKTQLFENTPVPRAVMNLAIPTVISSLVMVVYNIADTYFVSILGDPVQSSAVTLAAPILLAFNAVNNLFGVGASSMMSRGLGKKDFDTVRRSSACGFYLSLLCGVLFSLLYTAFHTPLLGVLGADETTAPATFEYLKWTVSFGAAPAILNVVTAYLVRAEGASLHAGIGTMSGCVLNILLDPVFIMPWGLNMGAAGAGLATFLSNCFSCGYFLILLLCRRGKTFVCLNPAMLRPKKAILFGIFAVGVPAAVQNLLNVTGMTVLNNFTAAFGASAVAAMGIAQKINMIPMQIALGFSQGIMPLISYNYAARNMPRMKKALFFAMKVMLVFLCTVTLGYYIFAGRLTAMFMNQPTIVTYGTALLRGMCLGIPFLCIDFLAVGVFQACGMGKKALLFAILRKIILEIPAIILLNYFFPLYGLGYSQFAAELILAVAAVIALRGILSKPRSDAA